ncbi:MAG: hypothetical protein ACREKG_08635 [Candidatus Rokuibacteriota bacterium]
MRVETLLPLGKLDPGLRAAETSLDLGRVVEDARLVESLGYDGLAVEETYAVVGTYAEIGRKLVERYRGLVTDVEFSIPAGTAREQGILRELVQDIRRDAS